MTPTQQGPANESVDMADLIQIYQGMLTKANHDLAIMEARVLNRDKEIARLKAAPVEQ